MPSAKYVVNIFEKNAQGTMNLIGTKSTEKNYTRLDLSYLSLPNIYYSIYAYNNGNGALIDTGDEIILAPPGGPSVPLCSVKCNSGSFAWELTYLDVNSGTDRLFLNSTVDYYDNSTGIVYPFWQAINSVSYNQLPPNHPYISATSSGVPGAGPNYIYKHKQITDDLILLNEGAFFDKNNNPVTDGWLIEKKMDQFEYMTGSVTSADPGINYCGSPGNGWMGFYNAYVDVSTYSQSSIDYTFFAPTLPTQLQCYANGFDEVDFSANDFENYTFVIGEWVDCMWGNLTISEYDVLVLDPECAELATAPGNPFTGFEFEQINNPSLSPANSISVKLNNDGTYTKLSQVGHISGGLYNLYVYTRQGKMLTSVYELPERQVINKRSKDYVKVEIAPNRIENDVLKFKISSEKDLPVTITVRKLNGQTIYTENTTLSNLIDLLREIEVGNGSTPYNQIILTLSFADGSSIQQTALKL